MVSSDEKPILNLCDLYWSRALLVIIRHVIDSSAHWIRAHETVIVGLQQFGNRCDILHSGIEPQIVIGSVEDDRHAVVDGRRSRIRRCREN